MGSVMESHLRIFKHPKILDSGLQNAAVTHRVVAIQICCEHRLERSFASERHGRYRVTGHGTPRGQIFCR